jgi:hypothetical protein
MKISKKQLTILLGIIVLLVISNVAVALYYMSRSVDLTGGVDTVGSIEVYDEDGVTLWASYEFPNFTGGTAETHFKTFFINNTGNQPVAVYWNISTSSLSWLPTIDGYSYSIDLTYKYYFNIQTSWPTPTEYWAPNDYIDPDSLLIPVGEGKQLRIFHQYSGNPNTAETYSLTITFYAEDS